MSINTQKAKQYSRNKYSANYTLGINATKNLEVSQDAQLLAECIISYVEKLYPNFVFTDFYDPWLIKTMRNIIKNKEEFSEFLNTISFSVEDFLEISVYVIPNIYTSHLIKFIKTTYLGLAVPEPKKKTKSKKV